MVRGSGIGKGHHDPPGGLVLRKLLCFSPAVWERLRELAGGGAGRRLRRARPTSAVAVIAEARLAAPDDGVQLEDRHTMGIELLNRPTPCWAWPRWQSVLDHQQLCKDPSLELRLYLRKVFGRG